MSHVEQDKTNHNKQPGLTVSLLTILDVIHRKYSVDHMLVMHPSFISGVDDPSGKCERDFKDLEELYRWTLDTQAELDERDEQKRIDQLKNVGEYEYYH